MGIQDVLNNLPEPEMPDPSEVGDTEIEPTAEVAAEPEEEVSAQPEEAQETHEEDKPQSVPLGKLVEERERRRQLQQQMAAMEERFNQFVQGMQQKTQPQKPEEEAPSYDDDPIGHLKHQNAELMKRLDGLTQNAAQQTQQSQWRDQVSALSQAEEAFSREHTDYHDRARWIQERRVQELSALGFDNVSIQKTLAQDALSLMQAAQRQGMSAPEFVYEVAGKLGYQPKPVVNPAEKKPAPKSLGGASGTPDDAMPSLAEVSRMSDDEFNKTFKRYFGGR